MRNVLSSSSRSCLLTRSILLEAYFVYINLVSFNIEKKNSFSISDWWTQCQTEGCVIKKKGESLFKWNKNEQGNIKKMTFHSDDCDLNSHCEG